MQEVLATLLIASIAIAALVAVVIASLRVLHVAAGMWAATGGPQRPRRPAPPEEPAPVSRPWPPRKDETFFPTYLAGVDTSAELAAALARARAAVRVDHIMAVCKSFRVRCEMRDVDGRLYGLVEPDGSLKQA